MAAPPIKPMKSRRLMPASQGFQTMMLPNEGVGLKAVMSALGQKRTCAAQNGMSALGQKQTCAVHKLMSALPPIATSIATSWYVRSWPKADIEGVSDELGDTRQNNSDFCE